MKFILAFSLLTLAGGCAAVIYPTRVPVEPVAVYVADYGVHSSLLLPTEDGRFVEYAFGDWGYSAENHSGPQDVLGALFVSLDSAFGRRYTTLEPGQTEPRPVNPSPRKLVRIYASRGDVLELEREFDERFIRAADTVVHNPDNDTDYVRDEEHYSIAHNCNHLTAASLRKLGCDVKGLIVLSHFRVGAQQQLPPEHMIAASHFPATMPSASAE